MSADLSGRRILLVDDEPDSLEIQCLTLEMAGACVQCVPSVAAALEILPDFRPDLIVTDLAMPEADGFELLRQVRMLQARSGKEIPIVVLSGHADYLGERATREGAAIVLSKPVDPRQLTRIAASLI